VEKAMVNSGVNFRLINALFDCGSCDKSKQPCNVARIQKEHFKKEYRWCRYYDR